MQFLGQAAIGFLDVGGAGLTRHAQHLVGIDHVTYVSLAAAGVEGIAGDGSLALIQAG